jgi:hypothetical protein
MPKGKKRVTTDTTLQADLEASLALQAIETHPCRIARKQFSARLKADVERRKWKKK